MLKGFDLKKFFGGKADESEVERAKEGTGHDLDRDTAAETVVRRLDSTTISSIVRGASDAGVSTVTDGFFRDIITQEDLDRCGTEALNRAFARRYKELEPGKSLRRERVKRLS